MAQHDYNIANAPGATVRADINALAEAIVSLNSGTTSPTVTFPFMFWMDTFTNTLKIRNSANNAWMNFLSISGSTIAIASNILPLAVSGSWFGTNVRYGTIDTSGVMEIGGSLDFHPDAAGTEDYRLRLSRATGTNGAAALTNTGSGGIDISTSTGTLRVNGTELAFIPVGLIAPFIGSTAPTKWLLLAGQNISRATYATLFALIGTYYGVGDGSTTFTLPDLRGRTIAGVDNMGGVSANRVTLFNGDVLGNVGGAESVVLGTGEIPSHTHTIDPPSTAVSVTVNAVGDHGHPFRLSIEDNASIDPSGGLVVAANGTLANYTYTGTPSSTAGRQIGGDGAHTHTANGSVDIAAFASAAAGSGGAHSNLQPTIMLSYIVFVGV